MTTASGLYKSNIFTPWW